MSSLERVCDPKQGGELGDTDAIGGSQFVVVRVGELGGGFAVIAGDERDEEAVGIAEAEDFGLADDVKSVEFVRFWRNVVANFVKNGGDFEEEGVVVVEFVKFAGFLKKPSTEMGNVAGVAHVTAKLLGGEL